MFAPPDRFAHSTFDAYRPERASQEQALAEAQAFVAWMRARPEPTLWNRVRSLFSEPEGPNWQGLYLVGPVGTGKTHLLAAMYHALHPGIPCAFLPASRFFRMADHPEAFARDLAQRYRVLCMDEVEIDDAANEARLVLLLRTLERLGVRLLATSNVEPDQFLSAQAGTGRFGRFLTEQFREAYKIVFVGGDDYRRRLAKPGEAWIGPAAKARAALMKAFDADERAKRWLGFETLIDLTTDVAHDRLLDDLGALDALYLADIAVSDTDDALRLLRVIDDLYLRPDPPVLYFSSAEPPGTWFEADAQHSTMGRGIAEKFERTVSRLHALCEIHDLHAEARRSA